MVHILILIKLNNNIQYNILINIKYQKNFENLYFKNIFNLLNNNYQF